MTFQLSAAIEKCSNLNEKIEAFVKYCPASKMNMTVDDQRAVLLAVYKRVQALYSYDVSQFRPLKTPITLLKPTVPSLKASNEDYGLSKVHVLAANLIIARKL